MREIKYNSGDDKVEHKLYLVALTGETHQEYFGKFGVTKKEVLERFKNEKKYQVLEIYEFDCVDGIQARGIESILKEKLVPHNKLKYEPKCYFNGYSECFNIESIDEIALFIYNEYGIDYSYTPLFKKTIKPITLAEYFRRHPREVIEEISIEEEELLLPDWMIPSTKLHLDKYILENQK